MAPGSRPERIRALSPHSLPTSSPRVHDSRALPASARARRTRRCPIRQASSLPNARRRAGRAGQTPHRVHGFEREAAPIRERPAVRRSLLAATGTHVGGTRDTSRRRSVGIAPWPDHGRRVLPLRPECAIWMPHGIPCACIIRTIRSSGPTCAAGLYRAAPGVTASSSHRRLRPPGCPGHQVPVVARPSRYSHSGRRRLLRSVSERRPADQRGAASWTASHGLGITPVMRSCQWLTRALLCALVAVAATRADLGAQLQDHQYSSTDIGTGLRIYSSQCALCHGPNGDLVAGVNLRRGQFRRPMSDDDLRRVITTGVPSTPMPPFKLQPNELDGLVAFIRAGFDLGGTAVKVGDAARRQAALRGQGRLRELPPRQRARARASRRT